jgi:hypothetical protein
LFQSSRFFVFARSSSKAFVYRSKAFLCPNDQGDPNCCIYQSPHQQPPAASSEPPRPANDSSVASGLAVVVGPLKKAPSSGPGRHTRKGAKADGEFVHASLKEIRNKVGFIKPMDIHKVKNKDQLESALKALLDSSFHSNKRHFRPEPNHFGR